MRVFLATISAAALLSACGAADTKSDTPAPQTETKASVKPATKTANGGYDITRQYEKFAEVPMNPDVSFLSSSERKVVNKLIEASDYLSQIYMLQRGADYPQRRAALEKTGSKIEKAMFDLHYGPCDGLEDDNHVFVGDTPCPVGAGFYPVDMSKEEFETWITDHPNDKEAFTSGYTVIRRTDDGGLKAIPYHVEYAEYLKPAAKLMREAAEITENANLRNFLNLRAKAFLNDDYFKSELAWMELDGPIEIAIGPYEVYDDGLFAYKTAYESFVTVKNPDESAALAKYKDFLKDMEKNLPVPESYKNYTRGFESPIAVTYHL